MALKHAGELKVSNEEEFFDELMDELYGIFEELARLGNGTTWVCFHMDSGLVEVHNFKRFPVPSGFMNHDFFSWIQSSLLESGYQSEMSYCLRDNTCSFQVSWN